jgi:hypothetical protein
LYAKLPVAILAYHPVQIAHERAIIGGFLVPAAVIRNNRLACWLERWRGPSSTPEADQPANACDGGQ